MISWYEADVASQCRSLGDYSGDCVTMLKARAFQEAIGFIGNCVTQVTNLVQFSTANLFTNPSVSKRSKTLRRKDKFGLDDSIPLDMANWDFGDGSRVDKPVGSPPPVVEAQPVTELVSNT